MSHKSLIEIENAVNTAKQAGKSIVCVQGLGFVGFAMAVAVATARNAQQQSCFLVIGVDIDEEKIGKISEAQLPIQSSDPLLAENFHAALQAGDLIASSAQQVFRFADITVVDIPLDISMQQDQLPQVDFSGFRAAIATLGQTMPADSLILVETTVPPGTTRTVVMPTVAAELQKRQLPSDAIAIAHSYERVMPGENYYNSIVNYWRVYAGEGKRAAQYCRKFLQAVVNTASYPLTELENTLASETAKIVENSYRALNIAFMDEWGKFAEQAGIDMFAIVAAIRQRPTHSNMMLPGFGVGGYCLTKDPLFARVACQQTLSISEQQFPLSEAAVAINNRMPANTLEKIRHAFAHTLKGKKVLIVGVSYRPDIGDSRYSPAADLYRFLDQEEVVISCHDPYLQYWQEVNTTVSHELGILQQYDCLVFTVAHSQYQHLDFIALDLSAQTVIIDANNVLTAQQLMQIQTIGCPLEKIGVGVSA